MRLCLRVACTICVGVSFPFHNLSGECLHASSGAYLPRLTFIFSTFTQICFSVCLCVCACIPFLLALECFFGLSVSDFSFSFLLFGIFLLFPLSTFTCDSLFVFLSIFGAPFSLYPLLSLSHSFSLSVSVTSVCHESRSKSAFYKDLLRIVPLQCRQTQTQT